jgi:Tfp pilus assembly protein PilN
MRPVNLIPPEDRRGEAATSRAGLAPYAIVGVLAIAVVVVAIVTLLGNGIDDKKAEVARLEVTVQESQARADALDPYVNLANLAAARSLTIDSLAKSRFDWERVLRELSRVTPSSISLTGLTGTITPAVTMDGGADVGLRSEIPGPALEIVGCADSQRKLAEFMSSLHDIDGVSRVAAETGTRENQDASGSSTGTSGGCVKPGSSTFEVVAALEAVPVPTEADLSAAAAPVATPTSAPASSSTDGGVGAAQQAQSQQQSEISNAASKSDSATNLIPGG